MPKNFQTYTIPAVTSAVSVDPSRSTGPRPSSERTPATGPLAGSKMNRMTTPTIAVVVTTGMKNAVRKNPVKGSRGEVRRIATATAPQTRSGATTSVKSIVTFTDDQNCGSARTFSEFASPTNRWSAVKPFHSTSEYQ